MIVLRKHINVLEGQQHLEDEIRYFFYVTNVAKRRLNARKAIFESNVRCHQENLIEQLKNGVRAMQMPSGSFTASWVLEAPAVISSSEHWRIATRVTSSGVAGCVAGARMRSAGEKQDRGLRVCFVCRTRLASD